MVPRRRGLHGLLGLASLADRPGVPGCGRVATTVASGWAWCCRGGCKRVARAAETIFQDTRMPLTV
jgi:hypothetical protein